jgi:microcystin degradation protein MlrC
VRIAIGGFMHESNTFSPALTGLDAFSIQRGDELIHWWEHAHHEVGGFIEGATRFGYELVPLIMANATPSGKVTAEAFEAILTELIETLQSVGPVDGLLLALHGAMVSEDYPDGDGEIVRQLRRATGPDFPIVVTHDLHANIAEEIVDACTALIVYKTYPHLDQRERGLQAAEMIARTVRREINPVQAISKPPMILNIVHGYTSVNPMKSIMHAVRDAEEHPKVLAASLAEGYQYADVAEMGPSIIIVTDGDQDLANREVQRLSELLWNSRDQLRFDLPNAAETVRRAQHSEQTPVVLVDMGDNIGGGSAGDSTFILSELLHQQAEAWLVVLADPEAVLACAKAGIGASVTLEVGGKTDQLHGKPVTISGRVKCLHDGKYMETVARHGGGRYRDQGLTAVLDIPGTMPDTSSYLILTTRREPPFSLQQLLSVGIQPQQLHILVVKAAIAFRAAYEPIAGQIIEVDTGGLTAVDLAHFAYHHIRENLWAEAEKRDG